MPRDELLNLVKKGIDPSEINYRFWHALLAVASNTEITPDSMATAAAWIVKAYYDESIKDTKGLPE